MGKVLNRGFASALFLFFFGTSAFSQDLLHQKNGGGSFYNLGLTVAGAGDVNGDGYADFIIGAPHSGFSYGSAYVYSGLTGGLLYQKNGSLSGGELGRSVDGAGDVNGDGKADFIIGHVYNNPGGLVGAGSAYVYSGADGSLLYQKNGAGSNYFFGGYVAGAGDVNGDGKADFIVGAYGSNSAYVYSGADGSLLYQKSGATVVAGAGDVNGDGKTDFITGDFNADPGGLTDAGSAYVYSGSDGSLLYQKNGGAANDWLGISVDGAGDVNGDGKADFIVGARQADPGGLTDAGSAYVYSGSNGSLLYQKNGGAAGDALGQVAGAGDVNGDGKADFIVGAFAADPGGLDSAGSAYVYSGATGALLDQKNGAAAVDQLGVSVAGAGDVNGDGKSDFIIGAWRTDPGGNTDAGSAYVYRLETSSPSVTVTAPNGGEALGQPCPYNITWNASDNIGVTAVEIWLDRTNGGASYETQIASLSSNPGSYSWTPGGPNSNNAKIKVIARDAAGNTAFDESDASFSIVVLCVAPKVAALRNLPTTFELRQNYPNPFNPTATIEYALPQAEKVELRVFNILGQAIRTLVDEEKPAGYHQAVWDGKDKLGQPISSGIYLYQIRAGDFVKTMKMSYIK